MSNLTQGYGSMRLMYDTGNDLNLVWLLVLQQSL
jgi:hypothetical protein